MPHVRVALAKIQGYHLWFKRIHDWKQICLISYSRCPQVLATASPGNCPFCWRVNGTDTQVQKWCHEECRHTLCRLQQWPFQGHSLWRSHRLSKENACQRSVIKRVVTKAKRFLNWCRHNFYLSKDQINAVYFHAFHILPKVSEN